MKAKDINGYRERAEHLKDLFPSLTVTLTGTWVWVEGDTKPHKEELKAEGLRWARKKGKWYLAGLPARSRGGSTWQYITAKYGEETIDAHA